MTISTDHPKSMYIHGAVLCTLLCATNASGLCLAVVGARMLSPSLHNQPGQALFQSMRRWMSFLEGKNVAALHIAALLIFY